MNEIECKECGKFFETENVFKRICEDCYIKIMKLDHRKAEDINHFFKLNDEVCMKCLSRAKGKVVSFQGNFLGVKFENKFNGDDFWYLLPEEIEKINVDKK